MVEQARFIEILDKNEMDEYFHKLKDVELKYKGALTTKKIPKGWRIGSANEVDLLKGKIPLEQNQKFLRLRRKLFEKK